MNNQCLTIEKQFLNPIRKIGHNRLKHMSRSLKNKERIHIPTKELKSRWQVPADADSPFSGPVPIFFLLDLPERKSSSELHQQYIATQKCTLP